MGSGEEGKGRVGTGRGVATQSDFLFTPKPGKGIRLFLPPESGKVHFPFVDPADEG